MSLHFRSNGFSRREVLSLPLAPMLASADTNTSVNWLAETWRELHLDAHFGTVPAPYGDFRADVAAGILKDASFQMVSCFASCGAGYSYYPTNIGTPHPGLTRDFTGEMAGALKKRGIRVLAYISVGPDRRYHQEHPDWVIVRNPPQPSGEMAMMCLSSPWVDEVHIPQMKELVAKYGVDGFFLDNLLSRFTRGPCYCRYCREAFRAANGFEIPTDEKDAHAPDVHRWLTQNMARYADKVTSAMSGVKANLAYVFTHVWVSRNPVKPPASVKQLVWEPAPPYPGVLSLDFSFESRYLATQSGVDNFSCMATRGNGWGDYSLRDPDAFRHEAAVMLAGGGRPYLADDSYPSGNPDPAVYDVYREVNKRTRSIEAVVRGCEPVRDIAVLLSAESMWAKLPLTPPRDWMTGPASPAVSGAHTALTEIPAQFSVINSETLLETLQDYKALILAEQCVLSDKECAAIRRFVLGGGALIATGDTGARSGFPLADVLGLKFGGMVEARRSFLRGFGGMDIQVSGSYCRVQTTTARVVAQLVPAGAKQSPTDAPEGPGITINRFGSGQAIYCACPLFSTYYAEGTPALRKLAAWMLEQVHPASSRSIAVENAPLTTEVFYNVRGKDRVLHLVNFTGDRRLAGPPRVQDAREIGGVRVHARCSARPHRVFAMPEQRNVPFEWRESSVIFEAPPFTTHGVWVIEA